MAESTRPVAESRLTQIEPDERLVVLARTMQAQGPGLETAWEDGATNWNSFGETYLGRRSIGTALFFKALRKRPYGAISN